MPTTPKPTIVDADAGSTDEATPTYFVMPVEQQSRAMLLELDEARVEFLVVGAMARVLQGLPTRGTDLDIVHRPTPENVARLLSWLLAHDAHDCAGLPYRRLRPTEATLLGQDDILLQTDIGKLNLRHAPWGGSYEGMLSDATLVDRGDIERLVAANACAAPIEGHAALPVLIITLDRTQKAKEI